MMKIQEANQKSENINQQIEVVDQQTKELKAFKNGLENLGNSEEKEILASIGKGVFIKSEIKEKNLFVDVGAGIFVRKGFEETIKVSEDQIKKLEEMKLQLTYELSILNSELELLIENAGKEEK